MDIDIVVLWVDGSDPEWQARKRQYLPPTEADSDSANRYRDWGLLPYWFRSVETFAPWVRKVHFVTCGHVPAFLNLHCPKLNFVTHDQFIPQEYLPTFSSHTIEANIHRIPGLSEHFIYFNDDMFLLKPMDKSDFFRDGLPCTYGGEVPWYFNGKVGVWEHAVANNLGVINRHFPKRLSVIQFAKKYMHSSYRWKDNLRTFFLEKLFPDYFTGFKNLHAPAAYLKKTFDDLWFIEHDLLHATCTDKFRSCSNLNQWVFLWWQVASGQFSPYVVDNLVSGIENKTIDMLCDCITKQQHAMICLNDPEYPVDFERLSGRLREAFESLLPQKSSFEL